MKSRSTVLELKKVIKSYKLGNQKIQPLQSINFAIHPGEFVAMMGPSGAGKSTLLQIASLLDNPNSGQILLHGKDL